MRSEIRTKRDESLYRFNVAACVRNKSEVITSGAADACKKQRHHTRISPFRVACVVRQLSERGPDFDPDMQPRGGARPIKLSIRARFTP